MTREEAIELLRELSNFVATPPETDEAINMAIEALKQKSKCGKWVDDDNSFYANCSECGYQIDTHEERGYHNFCPYCGVRME